MPEDYSRIATIYYNLLSKALETHYNEEILKAEKDDIKKQLVAQYYAVLKEVRDKLALLSSNPDAFDPTTLPSFDFWTFAENRLKEEKNVSKENKMALFNEQARMIPNTNVMEFGGKFYRPNGTELPASQALAEIQESSQAGELSEKDRIEIELQERQAFQSQLNWEKQFKQSQEEAQTTESWRQAQIDEQRRAAEAERLAAGDPWEKRKKLWMQQQQEALSQLEQKPYLNWINLWYEKNRPQPDFGPPKVLEPQQQLDWAREALQTERQKQASEEVIPWSETAPSEPGKAERIRKLTIEFERAKEEAAGAAENVAASKRRPGTPETPEWLASLLGMQAGQPLQKKQVAPMPLSSWASMPASRQAMMQGYMNWTGQPYEDWLQKTQRAGSQTPSGYNNWTPIRQRSM